MTNQHGSILLNSLPRLFWVRGLGRNIKKKPERQISESNAGDDARICVQQILGDVF